MHRLIRKSLKVDEDQNNEKYYLKKNVVCEWYRDGFESCKWKYISKNFNIFLPWKQSPSIILYLVSDKYFVFDSL